MKLVIDTNIIFSALYNPDSDSGKLILLAIEDKVTLLAPEEVREELRKVLGKRLDYSDDEINDTLRALPITWIDAELYQHAIKYAKPQIKHEKDVPVLACALALDLPIVSGNKHLLLVKKTVAEVWKPKELIGKLAEK